MKVCVVGAGAIGGLLGVNLSCKTDAEITMVARGKHLDAIRRHGGLQLRDSDGSMVAIAQRALYVETVADVPRGQDIVILGIKEHQIASIVDALVDLLKSGDEETMLVTTQNGVPWWFFQRHQACPNPEWIDSKSIQAVDPEGTLMKKLDPKYIVGCVVYPAASIVEPGVIQHHEGNRFPIGELDGSFSARTRIFSELLIQAGFKSFVLDNIRNEIWLKVWGSAAFNPLSALTNATLAQICRFELSRTLVEDIMNEVAEVGLRVGAGAMRVPLEKRIQGAQNVGDHKTSMLQDIEQGRPTEIESIVGSIVELAELTQVQIPSLRAIYCSMKLLEKVLEDGQVAVRTSPRT